VAQVTTHVITLSEASGHTALQIGGKAAGLTQLVAHDFPVPDGVVVTAGVFAEAAAAADLLGPAPNLDRAALDARYERASKALLDATLPSAVETTVRDALSGLLAGGGAVAVRSSATLEDSATASFSGMLHTITGVTSADSAIDAVRRCWVSAFLPRVARYLAEKGYEPRDLLVAVVIQRQIEAERSGLIFSRDPANRYSSGVIVEAICGAGEDLVSGEATPERYRYSFDSKRVTVTRMEGQGVVEGPACASIMDPDEGD
jgi:pyruvate,water dikinase